jgi:HMG (high mobility group) box
VSKAWKDLTPEEKDEWEDQARRDKARFEVEKSLYTGPWKVPAKKRSQKDPNAPKRPMSAFLAYSHAKRAEVKKKSPNMNNAEISRVLAQLWKDAPEEEKKEHIEKEYQLRQKYLTEIAVWRENTEKEFNEQRKSREDIAMKTVAARSSARDDEAHDPATSYEKDRDGDKGGGKYSGYYPPHHLYYAPNAPSQGPYGQEYPPSYAPPYYHPAATQHTTSEHYEQQLPRSEIAGSQDGYNDYYAQAGYGQYPPTGSSSDPYPPGGHESYPSRGYSGSYAGALMCLYTDSVSAPTLAVHIISPTILVPSFQSIQ